MKNNKKSGDVGARIMLWLIVLIAGILLLGTLLVSSISFAKKPTSVNTVEQGETEEAKNGFSGVKNETATETIRYSSSTIKDENLDEGRTEIRVQGVNGTKKITYKVTYENGEEVGREKISEEVTKQPINEVKAVGTKHNYTGSCTVSGAYRKRYASCTGDYSPQAKANAEAKARECNINSRAVQGCYNTYR